MEPRQSCFARMLDIRGYVLAARAATAVAEPAAALAMIALFGLIALCLLPIWITFDLNSTWAFTTGLRQASEPVITSAATDASGFLGITLAALITGAIFTGFTLLPSLFELAFPTVSHPLLSLLLLASIVFDYVTDWGKAWETSAGWAAEGSAAHVLYCAAFCLFVSVTVQALLVVCLTVVIFAVGAILRGGSRAAQAVIIDR